MRYQQDRSTATDALFNHMSAFIQALGRVERVWQSTPDQTVLLSREVYHRFLAFCTPEYEPLRQERDPIISNNLRQLFALVEESRSHREREVRRRKDARLEAKNDRCREAIKDLLIRLEGLRNGNGDSEARTQWQKLRRAVLKHDFGDEVLQAYECVVSSPYYVEGILYLTTSNEIIPAHLAGPDTYPWRMDALYDVIASNRVIRDFFLLHGYELAFNRTCQQFFTPYCYQAILAGAIGEEAINALLQDEGIQLEELPHTLFEIADLKIRGFPWYIDCKNYNERTLERFAVPKDDPAWHPKLNEAHFKQRARAKVEMISTHHNTTGKLIYLNLVSSQDRPFDYYDQDFLPVNTFADAAVVVVQGVLQRSAPNAYQQGFEHFLHDISLLQKGVL